MASLSRVDRPLFDDAPRPHPLVPLLNVFRLGIVEAAMLEFGCCAALLSYHNLIWVVAVRIQEHQCLSPRTSSIEAYYDSLPCMVMLTTSRMRMLQV